MDSAKDDKGKLKLSLVPGQILRDIAVVREYGCKKYHDPENWRKVELQRYIDAFYRHWVSFVEDNNSIDEESGIPHYKHCACNMAFICELIKKGEQKMRTYEERIKLFSSFLKPHLKERDFDTLYQWCIENEFFSQAASTKYHGNYPGGLFDHSYNVAETLVRLTKDNDCVQWERPESPYIIGMFHDICKTDNYLNGIDGYEYNTDTLLKGHGDKSVMILAALLPLTEEEVMCIRYHMGAFTDSGEWNYYTRAIHKYPNVLWSHHADMIAAHIIER